MLVVRSRSGIRSIYLPWAECLYMEHMSPYCEWNAVSFPRLLYHSTSSRPQPRGQSSVSQFPWTGRACNKRYEVCSAQTWGMMPCAEIY